MVNFGQGRDMALPCCCYLNPFKSPFNHNRLVSCLSDVTGAWRALTSRTRLMMVLVDAQVHVKGSTSLCQGYLHLFSGDPDLHVDYTAACAWQVGTCQAGVNNRPKRLRAFILVMSRFQ